MNFFNRNHPPSPASPSSPSLSPAPPSSPTPLPPMDNSNTPPKPLPTTPPPSDAPPKKSRFPHFRNPLSRKTHTSSDKSQEAPLSSAIASTHIPAPTPDQIARRAARRAERERLRDEWAEKNHELRKQAVAEDRPFVPLPPPPDINSDSETDHNDHHQPETIPTSPSTQEPQSMGVQHEVGANGMDHKSILPPASSVKEEHQDGPHMATTTGAQEDVPGQDGAGVPVPAGPPRDLVAEAKMAEMFGRQAYTGLTSGMEPTNGTVAEDPGMSAGAEIDQISGGGDATGRGTPPGPTRVGWGDAYGSVPSQPMYGNPMMSYTNPASDIDYVLSEKIRRGRELGRLAVLQEEQGNLGAAESGYLKALELLVPSTRELDVGSELTKNARMNMKKKVQREAGAMLDRVEELKMFLKANGPAIPKDMPVIPVVIPSQLKGRGTQYRDRGNSDEHDARERIQDELNKQRGNSTSKELGSLSMVKPKKKQPDTGRAPNRLPPPPPPFFDDNESGDLLKRISNRKNIVSAASAGFHSVRVSGITSHPDLKAPRAGTASCFVCNAAATVAAPCNHTFCSICGRQAASVFGKCPVPGCGEPLSAETFSELQ